MTEPLIMLMLVSGVLFWMLGGTVWKGFRRYGWPVVAGVLLVLSGLLWWRAALATLLLMGVNLAGYGDASRWWKRVIVFTALTAPALAINPLVWPVIPVCGVLATAFFYTTRNVSWVSWKLWEGMAGFLQAAALVMATLR